MAIEIETRTLVGDAEVTVTQLRAAGFVEHGGFLQVDIMHDKPDGSLFRSGQKIRIRVERETAELTYKGPFHGDPSISRRIELNLPIDIQKVEQFSELLTALGFPILFRVKKQRLSLRNGDVIATIDTWPIIGPMLELEGPEQEIRTIGETLFPEKVFKNYRLKELFEAQCELRGVSLQRLQQEYEDETGFKLGNISFLIQ